MTKDGRRRMTPTCRHLVLSAAGGLQCLSKGMNMPITDLGCDTNTVVFPNSPDALSMGENCVGHGWHFFWVKGVPWFVTDKNERINLDVENKCSIAKSRYTVQIVVI